MSHTHHLVPLILLVVLSSVCAPYQVESAVISSWPGGLIIDHNHIDLAAVPSEWIDAAQTDVKVHYAHTSHGEQITTGLELIEASDSTYGVSIGVGYLPSDEGALCILDGNPPQSYITPDLYWQGAPARFRTQITINNNPTLTVSLWSWCTQLDYYDEAGTQEYLEAMSILEAANPHIIFVYMTCNAQEDGSAGYNRWQNNEMIRQYCLEHDKILFDFADLDCWSNDEHSTYTYEEGEQTFYVPVEHEDFSGDEAGHTTLTSCEQKGRAFWWMVSMLAGWNNPQVSGSTPSTTENTSWFLAPENLILTGVGMAALLAIVVIVRRKP